MIQNQCNIWNILQIIFKNFKITILQNEITFNFACRTKYERNPFLTQVCLYCKSIFFFRECSYLTIQQIDSYLILFLLALAFVLFINADSEGFVHLAFFSSNISSDAFLTLCCAYCFCLWRGVPNPTPCHVPKQKHIHVHESLSFNFTFNVRKSEFDWYLVVIVQWILRMFDKYFIQCNLVNIP